MQRTQFLIIILLIANLVATIWFGLSEKTQPELSLIEKASKHELPPIISQKVREQLLQQFTTLFNASDYDGLYNMFGPAAKAQLNKDDVINVMGKLKEVFRSIQEGAYVNSEHVGIKGSMNMYRLNYSVKFSEAADFGSKGTLQIIVGVQGQEYQVFYMKLNIDNV